MDHRTIPTATRAAASIALAALLLYGGMALDGSDWSGAALAIAATLTVLGTVVAVWGLARLEASRVASGTVLVLLGLGPASAALGWWLTGAEATGLLGALLTVNALAGVATIILSGWLLAQGAPAREAARAPRVG